jgi:hypothetical protein
MAGRAAGGCVLAALGSTLFAAVFAASPTVGVLTLWTAGGIALWQATRRRVSDSSATPPPPPPAPSGDVYARETGKVARVVRGPEGVTCTVHMVREEVPNP